MPEQSPTVRRRRLAYELRRLRESVHLTGGQAAKRVSWSTSRISRLENAQVIPHEDDVSVLLDLYDVAGDKREQLLSLARDAAQKGWWEEYSDSWSEAYSTYIGLEAGAASMRTWQSVVFPGLLQTAEYSREVTRPWRVVAALPPSEIERITEIRLTRQAVLTRDNDPLDFTAVIDESVLHRRFGDNAVMRNQLLHVAELAELPNVTVHVLRLDGPHPNGAGAFVLLKFSAIDQLGPIYPDVLYVEHMEGSLYEEDEVMTYRYDTSFDHMVTSALNPEESTQLILKVAKDAWK